MISKVYALFVCQASGELRITPLGDHGACGADQPRYINETGFVFYSPGTENNEPYPPNSDCSWLIENLDGDDGSVSNSPHFVVIYLERWSLCD